MAIGCIVPSHEQQLEWKYPIPGTVLYLATLCKVTPIKFLLKKKEGATYKILVLCMAS